MALATIGCGLWCAVSCARSLAHFHATYITYVLAAPYNNGRCLATFSFLFFATRTRAHYFCIMCCAAVLRNYALVRSRRLLLPFDARVQRKTLRTNKYAQSCVCLAIPGRQTVSLSASALPHTHTHVYIGRRWLSIRSCFFWRRIPTPFLEHCFVRAEHQSR